jgi:hypothetical protein
MSPPRCGSCGQPLIEGFHCATLKAAPASPPGDGTDLDALLDALTTAAWHNGRGLLRDSGAPAAADAARASLRSYVEALRADRDAALNGWADVRRDADALRAHAERIEARVDELLGRADDYWLAKERAEAEVASLRARVEEAEKALIVAKGACAYEANRVDAAERESDSLRAALARAVEAIDRAEPNRHSPWCNGVHEGGACEGDYLMVSFMRGLRALLWGRGEQQR